MADRCTGCGHLLSSHRIEDGRCDQMQCDCEGASVCPCGRPGCDLPWSVHDWSYLAEVERNPEYANEPLFPT